MTQEWEVSVIRSWFVMPGDKSNITYCKTFGRISGIVVEKWGEENGKENFHFTASPKTKIE
jgi:hypothetical protein